MFFVGGELAGSPPQPGPNLPRKLSFSPDFGHFILIIPTPKKNTIMLLIVQNFSIGEGRETVLLEPWGGGGVMLRPRLKSYVPPRPQRKVFNNKILLLFFGLLSK